MNIVLKIKSINMKNEFLINMSGLVGLVLDEFLVIFYRA